MRAFRRPDLRLQVMPEPAQVGLPAIATLQNMREHSKTTPIW